MRKSRFTEDQMVKILREADKSSVPEVPKGRRIHSRPSAVFREYSTILPVGTIYSYPEVGVGYASRQT